jgi:LAGLIDADG DNA endonuclease family protein
MLNPNYVVGFVDGEGCFSISLNKNDNRIPEVRLIFEIELREDDEPILRKIQKVLGCGNIYRLEYERYAKWRPHVKLKVSNFSDISTKVIPFFQQHPLQAKKRLQFEQFCQVAELIKSKQHLTLEGIEKIRVLKPRDSLDALDAHVQWGAPEITRVQSPPVKP